jgi:hypothetical protein
MPAQPPVVAAHADSVPVVEAAPTLPPQAAVTPVQTVEGPDAAAAPALSEPETDGNAYSPAPVPPKASAPDVEQTVENPAALAMAPAPASPDVVGPQVVPAPAVSMDAGPVVLPVAEEAPVASQPLVADTVDVETAVSSAAAPPMVSAAPDRVAAQPALANPVAPRVTAAVAAETPAVETSLAPVPETADIPMSTQTPPAAPMPVMPTAVAVGAPVVEPQPGTVTPAPVAAPVAAAQGPEVMAPAAETVVPRFVPAAVLPEVPAFAAVGAVIVEGEPADVPAVWQPVVTPPVAGATAVAGMAVPRQSAMVVWPEVADAIPPLPVENDRRPAVETPVLSAPSRPQVFVDAPISPAWPEAVDVAAPPSRSPIVAPAPGETPVVAANPKADAPSSGTAPKSEAPAQEVRPVTAPAQPVMQPTGSRPVAKQDASQAVTPEPSAPAAPRGKQPLARVIDAPVAPWPAALSLDSVAPTMAAPVKRDAEVPARPVLAGVPAATVAPAEAVRGDVQTEVITSDIENATSGRMMVGAWQTYQQTPAVPASVRETGTMVPPLPVRLLNLALNLTSAGRRLDAPLLDGAVVTQPGLTTFNAVAVPVAPTADRSPIQSSPAADVTMPMDVAPTLPQTTGDVGGTVPQSPIDPVAAKPQRRSPVGIPTDAPVPVAVGDAFDAMVTDEASDLDILADWPEEEAIDGDLWPDEVPPEAAAEFLMALGNVVAGQSGQATAAAPATPDAAEVAPSGERRPAAAPSLSEHRPAPLPGPLPLHDHMANVQANTLMSGTPTEQPDAPAPATATTDAAPLSTGTGREGRTPAPTAAPTAAGQAPIPAAAPMTPAAGPVPPNAPIVDTTAPVAAAPAPARPDVRRPAPVRRAPEPVRARSEANEGALPIGLIPKAMVQPAAMEAPVTEPVLASGSPLPEATSGGLADHDGDAPPDQRQQTDTGVMPQAEPSPSFVNPMAFTPRPEVGNEAGAPVETLTVDAGTRRTTMAAPSVDADPIGPITVRTAEVAASKAPEAVAKMAEPGPPVTTAGMSAQQLIAAVNDGVPVHFAQFPNLVQGIVASKPFVDKTVDVVLQPENLGRIRLEVSLVEGGTAIRVAIATQTAAAQQVFESYGSRMQQIVQSQGYALKEFEVKISDRPIRSEGRGQSGNDAPPWPGQPGRCDNLGTFSIMG